MKRRAARLPRGTSRPSKPWQTRDAPLEATRDELLRRTLTTVDDCRALWEGTLDPFALCAAVALADLPRWLQDGLLVALTPPTAGVLAKKWRGGNRDRMNTARAWELIMLRTHPAREQYQLNWDRAPIFASGFLRDTNAAGTAAAIRQS